MVSMYSVHALGSFAYLGFQTCFAKVRVAVWVSVDSSELKFTMLDSLSVILRH